jgi:peptidoglycan/LPS O-acetylase OafA/YrhL
MFLQTVACVCYGTNDPLWSLAYEFWFYVLFPLGVGIVSPQVRWQSLVSAAALAVLALALPPALLEAGMIWLLGVLVYCLRNYQTILNPKARSVVLFVSLGLFLGTMLITKSQFVEHRLPRWLSIDFVTGLAFANVALQVLWAQPKMLIPLEKVTNWLSDISYTLYLFHFPVVVLCGGVLQGRQLQPTIAALGLYAVLLSLVVGLSYASWWLFERNTHVVRRALFFAAGLPR